MVYSVLKSLPGVVVVLALAFPTATAQDTTSAERTERPSNPLGARGGLEYTPLVAELFAAALSVGEKGTLTTLSVAPIRIWAGAPTFIYGITVTLAAESKKEITSAGGGYMAAAEWLFPGWQTRTDSTAWDRAVKSIDDGQVPECLDARESEQCRNARRAATDRHYDRSLIALLPRLSVRHTHGYFAVNTAISDQESVASRLTTLSADWRAGVYASVVGTYTLGSEREAAAAGTPLIGSISAAVTGVVLIPHLLGTSYYDDVFLAKRVQRGIGLGATYSVKRCESRDLRCPDGVLEDRLMGAVIDLRVSPDLTPRIVIGRRWIERLDQTEAFPQLGFQLAFSIHKSGR